MREPGSLQHAFDAWEEIARSLDEADKILMGFDFDGTLTPIVDNPDQVFIPPEVRATLSQLTSFEDISVAILSGRSLQDLKVRVQLTGLTLAGDHGLRIQCPEGREYQAEAATGQEELRSLIERIREETAAFPGILLEPKEFSLTVHFRGASSGAGEKLQTVLEEIVEGTPYILRSGRMCWELNPDMDWNKGRAFQWIKRHCLGETPNIFEIFVGDDRTDEDVFQLLQADGCPILVVSSEKVGPTQARYRLDSQEEVGIFLEKLMHNLSERPSRQPG